jgi:hypothetical protein
MLAGRQKPRDFKYWLITNIYLPETLPKTTSM